MRNSKKRNWACVEHYDNHIISDDGLIFNYKTNRISGSVSMNKGYRCITLWEDGIPKTYLLHRLVCDSFVDNPYQKNVVNHKDGNKLNNHFTNLEWVTQKENNQHAFKNKLIGYHTENLIFNKPKPIYSLNRKTLERQYFDAIYKASEQLNISRTAIQNALVEPQRTSGGFFWRYSNR